MKEKSNSGDKITLWFLLLIALYLFVYQGLKIEEIVWKWSIVSIGIIFILYFLFEIFKKEE